MDPTTNQDSNSTNKNPAGFNSGLDVDAINFAVAYTENTSGTPVVQNTFDVNDIDLTNTPTTGAQLEGQLSENPNMNLANTAMTVDGTNYDPQVTNQVTTPTPSSASQPEAEPKSPETAAFIEGDIVDKADNNAETGDTTAADAAGAAASRPLSDPMDAPALSANEGDSDDPLNNIPQADETKKQPTGIANATSKVQNVAAKSLQKIKPKSNRGVIVLVVIASIAVLAGVVALIVSLS